MFKFFLLLILTTFSAFADVPNPDFGFLFDRLPGQPLARKYNLGTKIREAHNTAICVYDYATSGGALGNIRLLSTDLKTPCLLPGKAIVVNALMDVTTAYDSTGSATVSVSTGQVTADLKTATAKGSFTAGQYIGIPVFATANTWLKLTGANSIVNGVSVNHYQPYITVAASILAAGHMRLFLDYRLSE